MWIKAGVGHPLVPHFNTFAMELAEHRNILDKLEGLNLFITAGFPTALMCAPRNANNSFLKPGFYSNLDLHAPNEASLAESIKVLEGIVNLGEVDYGGELVARLRDHPLALNLLGYGQHITLRKQCGSVEDILSRFTLKTNSFAYLLDNPTLVFEKETIKGFAAGKVVVNQYPTPSMTPTAEEIQANKARVVGFIYWLEKYAGRYCLTLDTTTFDYLVHCYDTIPNLAWSRAKDICPEGRVYMEGGVWVHYGYLLLDHNNWKSSLDKHGVITKGSLGTYSTAPVWPGTI